MPIVSVMQMTIDNVVGVISVRNRFMTAIGTVLVTFLVILARMPAGAAASVIERALIHMIAVLTMKMSFMDIIYVITMLNGGMTAVGSMLMFVVVMLFTSHHPSPFPQIISSNLI